MKWYKFILKSTSKWHHFLRKIHFLLLLFLLMYSFFLVLFPFFFFFFTLIKGNTGLPGLTGAPGLEVWTSCLCKPSMLTSYDLTKIERTLKSFYFGVMELLQTLSTWLTSWIAALPWSLWFTDQCQKLSYGWLIAISSCWDKWVVACYPGHKKHLIAAFILVKGTERDLSE